MYLNYFYLKNFLIIIIIFINNLKTFIIIIIKIN